MNISSSEQSLAKYHILHLVLGAIIAVVVLLVPKLATAVLIVVALAMLIPSATLPTDFRGSKWFDRAAVLVGAIVVAALFHFLHKL